MTFQNPEYFFLLLLLIPVIFWYFWEMRKSDACRYLPMQVSVNFRNQHGCISYMCLLFAVC